MLSPRFAKVMLEQYRKENGMVADSSFGAKRIQQLETKYGWGHESWVEDMANTIEKMYFDGSWTPEEVTRYIADFVRSCLYSSASSVSHVRDGQTRD